MRQVSIQVLGACLIAVLALLGAGMWGLPKYRIYSLEHRGRAQLREAAWTKKILIEEAVARKESARLYAEAEIERAKGVAEANRIIGDSLKGNEAYLPYLWIQGLLDGSGEVVYIPTEAGLPLLEATRGAPRVR